MKRIAALAAVALVSTVCARCAGDPPPAGPTGPPPSLHGDWSGPGVSFYVTEVNLRFTGVTLTYAFPGCSGTVTLDDENVSRTQPGVFGFYFSQDLPAGGPSSVQGAGFISGRSNRSELIMDGLATFYEGEGACKGGKLPFTAFRKQTPP